MAADVGDNPGFPQKLGSHDVVFEPDGASFLVKAMFTQLEDRASRGWRKERHTTAEQDRNHRHLDAINQARRQKAPKQQAAAEDGDVLPRFARSSVTTRSASALTVTCG